VGAGSVAGKVGIGGDTSKMNRINQHKKYGWALYKRLTLDTAEEIDSWTIWEEVTRVAGLRAPGNLQ
jgi:hypothetical protein